MFLRFLILIIFKNILTENITENKKFQINYLINKKYNHVLSKNYI